MGGCDKNMPGAMIAIARMNIPAIFVYGGTIKPGHLHGRDLTVVSAFEAVGQFSAGRIDERELLEVERHACPGKGSCGGMFTANTMSSVFEAMGMSLPGSSTMAAEDAEKAESAARSGEVLVERRPARAPARARSSPAQAFENGISVAMALGGSTNAVLHLLAIAHSAGVPLTLDDFEAIRARVPVLCDLKPSGRYVATDLHAAGGVPQVMKMLLAHGLLHGDALTITGETIAETLARRARRAPRRPGRHPAVGAAALRPGTPGGAARQPGARGIGREDHRRQEAADHRTGPRSSSPRRRASTRSSSGRIRAGRRDRDPLRGAEAAGPGMREMLAPTSAIIGAGLGDSVALITDGRFSGRDLRAGRGPRRARGGGRAGRSRCSRKAT